MVSTPSTYQPELVALSIIVACLAGYATLSLATGGLGGGPDARGRGWAAAP